MRRAHATTLFLFASFGLVSAASAAPTTYELLGVTFSDGGTAGGYFTFDPAAGTPCSTGATPCGRYSNVNITTTHGTILPGATYTYVCGQDVPSCTGITPDSTAALYLTTTTTPLTGKTGLAIFFTGVGVVPPAGLGQGTSFDISNSSFSVGAAQEVTCADPACSVAANPSRLTVAGVVRVLAPVLMSYAANLNVGESYIDVTNQGAYGAPLQGPGFGAATGNICVNVYAFDPGEELVSCCSCLVTPDQTVSLDVTADLTSNTQTGVKPTSVTIKLVSTLAGGTGSGTSCTNSAAAITTATLATGASAWGTTLHATPTSGSYATTERPFALSTFSPADLASAGGRCASILGNSSGFGICNSCRSGAQGAGNL